MARTSAASGRLIADRFHGDGAGRRAEDHFNRMVRDRQAPEEMPTIAVDGGRPGAPPALLADPLGVASRSEARRLIAGGGVSLDGEPVHEPRPGLAKPCRAAYPGRQAPVRPLARPRRDVGAAPGGRTLTGSGGYTPATVRGLPVHG